jgi:soluble lytic murein transglycosylase-like protein
MFVAASTEYGLPVGLLSRVAWQESHYKPDAVSPDGASGIMQIVPRYHPGVDPFDPAQAISYAAGYLRDLFNRFDSWPLALAAYNAGPGKVEKYSGIPPFPETVEYVYGIMRDVFDDGKILAFSLLVLVLFLLKKGK